MQAQAQSLSWMAHPAADKQVMLKANHDAMTEANNYSTAPVTGISCALIEELPTMALPISDTMTFFVEDDPVLML